MSFFNKINNNTIVDTLKQFCNRRDCKIQSSFIRSIRGGGRLLMAVFQRAFSLQRWGLGLAQCASPSNPGACTAYL